MAAQRTVLCPSCERPRVTKASGRQQLACAGCKKTFLVRDARNAPAPPVPPPPPPAPVTAAGSSSLGGVNVLGPARLDIGPLAFPEPAPTPAPEPAGGPEPAASSPAAVPAPPPVEPSPGPAPVPAGRRDYYARMTGGRR